MARAESKVLADGQLAAFDTEYVNDARWRPLAERIDERHPQGDFTFLDVGGGNGRFADRVLAAYPRATGVVLDNAALLLARNAAHPRKRLVCEPIERLEAGVGAERFDVIHLNWVLHHLVRDGYGATRRHVVDNLIALRRFLKPGGRISIYENMYDGAIVDGVPGRLIFALTSSRRLAPVVGRLGANTAGCGVCFQSRREWGDTLAAAGLTIERYTDFEPTRLRPLHRVALHAGAVRVGHFWCAG